MAAADIGERLAEFMGREDVAFAPEIPERYHSDWSSLGSQSPSVLVRPRTTLQVSQILQACSQTKTPVVPQGGLTGVSGGAQPTESCVVVSLDRMSGIDEIDPAASTMTVWAGTPLETVQKAAMEHSLYFPLDLGSRGSCVLGGNLSTNAGGNRVLRYGMMRDLVLGMEVVLPDGTVLTNLNKMMKNNTGYDLKQLFIGAEGTLGVVTRIVLRLYPLPASTHVALCGVPDYASVLQLLSEARRHLGPGLAAFEVMWKDYWDVATRQVPGIRMPLETDQPLVVLVETHGSAEADGGRFQDVMEGCLEAGTIDDAVLSQSLADAADFWGCRDAASEFIKVLGPHLSFDISLSVGDMDAYARALRQRLAEGVPGCRTLFYGHIADGNLHIIAWVPDAHPQPDKMVCDIVYDLVRVFRGSVSAEHGIGLTKKPYLEFSRSKAEIDLMRTIKKAIDPANIMNPGKIFDMGGASQ